MNKQFLLLAISFFFCATMFAQSNPIELFNGNMPSPTLFEETGNIGIGAIDPDSKLTIWSVYDRSNNLTPNAGLSVVNYNIGAGYTPTSFIVSRYSPARGPFPGVSSTDFIVDNNGNVGIGTASPQVNLDVIGNQNLSGNLVVGPASGAWGNVIVNGQSNSSLLNLNSTAGGWENQLLLSDAYGPRHIIADDAGTGELLFFTGNNQSNGAKSIARFNGRLFVGLDHASNSDGTVIINDPSQSGSTVLSLISSNSSGGWQNQIVFSDANGPRHVITDDAQTGDLLFHLGYNPRAGLSNTALFDGKVQIGGLKPTGSQIAAYANYLLAVQGNIICQKNIVQITDWSDKVFDAHYPLSSLSDVESYIKENKHLPEIPTECEAIENGVDLGEMNKLLLQKVEELTLYVIKQQKQIDAILKKQ